LGLVNKILYYYIMDKIIPIVLTSALIIGGLIYKSTRTREKKRLERDLRKYGWKPQGITKKIKRKLTRNKTKRKSFFIEPSSPQSETPKVWLGGK
tara:strand:- start:2581 stop:2865 length:285 start_codon:yes stop_codon:yes gene_type:complete